MKFWFIGGMSLILTACVSSSNVYQVQPGIYSVTATGDGFSTADRVVDMGMQKAQAQCAGLGKQVKVVNQQQSRTRMGIDTTMQILFQCI
jgi:hypothetical protein